MFSSRRSRRSLPSSPRWAVPRAAASVAVMVAAVAVVATVVAVVVVLTVVVAVAAAVSAAVAEVSAVAVAAAPAGRTCVFRLVSTVIRILNSVPCGPRNPTL